MPTTTPRPSLPAKGDLLRILGISFGIAVIVGGAIGSGILRTPGLVAAQLQSPRLIVAGKQGQNPPAATWLARSTHSRNSWAVYPTHRNALLFKSSRSWLSIRALGKVRVTAVGHGTAETAIHQRAAEQEALLRPVHLERATPAGL